MNYPFWRNSVIAYRSFRIADIREIALMKLLEISNRGSRKDFIDLYIILRRETTLKEYFRLLPEKYSTSSRSGNIKSLKRASDTPDRMIPA